MGDRLTDAGLFETALPAGFAPLLSLLAELERLITDKSVPDAERRAHADRLRTRLLARAGALVETAPAQLRAEHPDHRRWFTEAVLLWTHFHEAGGRVLVDSHASGTLAAFAPDLVTGDAERAEVRAALARGFGWSDEELAQIEAAIAGRISNLRIKTAIAALLADELVGVPGSPELAAAALRLFQRLYGPLPFRIGDVDVTLTTTTLMIGLPFEEGALLESSGASARAPEDRAALAPFLQQVQKYQNTFDTLRFPGFGLYDRKGVDPTLVAALGAAVTAAVGAVDERVVIETLATMVSLLPSHKADLFLVHDIWGHGWEESLCDFEWSYARLIELREPVHVGTGPRFGGEAAPALRTAFGVEAGQVVLDRALLAQLVAADLRGRVTVALNVVVSECLADLIEHKYVRRRAPTAPPLPSSSLFPHAPTKLDLSLLDTQTLLKAAHRPYRRLLAEPAERARLVAELAAAGLPDAGLAAAVEAAVLCIRTGFGHVLETRFSPRVLGDSAVAVNLAERVMLGMVGLHGVVTDFLDRADAARAASPEKAALPLWRTPAACIDLLVVVLGWFYEQDRTVHFWHLDELLRDELGAAFAKLEAALASG